MSVRSASRGSPAAKSIRLALRTSSIVETRSASFVRWVLRCFGRRCLSSEPTLSAIFLMPFIMCFQGPPGLEPLNHTPLPHVNSLASKLMDGKERTSHCFFSLHGGHMKEQVQQVEPASPSSQGEFTQLILVPGLLNDADLWRDTISGLSDIATCQVGPKTRTVNYCSR